MALTVTARHPRRARSESGVRPEVRPSIRSVAAPPVPALEPFSDECPFGIFGKFREEVRVLKPKTIAAAGAWIALNGDPNATPNDHLIRLLAERPDLFDTYSVIEAFDRSLMLPAQRQVFKLVADPCFVPDNPPDEIIERHLRANRMYPDATIYFAEPVFRVGTKPGELPVPVDETSFIREAGERTLAACRHARRYGRLYRTVAAARRFAVAAVNRIDAACEAYRLRRAEKAARIARLEAEEAFRQQRIADLIRGRQLGEFARVAEIDPRIRALRGVARDLSARELEAEQLAWQAGAGKDLTQAVALRVQARQRAWGLEVEPLEVLEKDPFLFMRLDPLLFLELPDEKGSLRLIGHWYHNGAETLVHV